MHVSLLSCSKLAFRNKIIENFQDFSLLLFSHRICPASDNILSQRTDVATHYSVMSGIQRLPIFSPMQGINGSWKHGFCYTFI